MTALRTDEGVAHVLRALRRLEEWPYATYAGQGLHVSYAADDLRRALASNGALNVQRRITGMGVAHGTLLAYEEHGCRCDVCATAAEVAKDLRGALAASGHGEREGYSAPEDAAEFASSSDAVSRAGITYRQLDYWVRKGFLRPGRLPGDLAGKGPDRIWPAEEVKIARRMGRLVAAGLPLAWAAEFARDRWPVGEIAEGIELRVTA